MNNPFALTNKTILVVGASSGIGQAIAVECSKMGARLILSARSVEGLEQTRTMLTGEGHVILPADITLEEDRKSLISQLEPVDGVVMSAGVSLILPIAFVTKQKMESIFDLNYFSQVEFIRLLNKKKIVSKGGSIVIISSTAGTTVHSHGNSTYGAAKAAFDSFMKFAACEYAHKKIRVNSIRPGMVYTKLVNISALSEEDTAADIERYPLKRYGQPEEIAYAAVYLLSDASAWVTGHALVVDGGISI